MKPEQKYADSITHVANGVVVSGYPGNCPFLRHNREEYQKEKEADAVRKEEKAEG